MKGGYKKRYGNEFKRSLDDHVQILYPHDYMDVEALLLKSIKKLFPDRYSVFMSKVYNAREPMKSERHYSIVAFNDHPDTTLDDVILVVKDANV